MSQQPINPYDGHIFVHGKGVYECLLDGSRFEATNPDDKDSRQVAFEACREHVRSKLGVK